MFALFQVRYVEVGFKTKRIVDSRGQDKILVQFQTVNTKGMDFIKGAEVLPSNAILLASAGMITSPGIMVQFFGNMKAVAQHFPLEIMVPLLFLQWCIQNLWASNWHI